MTIEDQILALLAKAEPLRSLPEHAQGDLGALVDKINALRAAQVGQAVEAAPAAEEGQDAPTEPLAEAPKRRGRPPKAAS